MEDYPWENSQPKGPHQCEECGQRVLCAFIPDPYHEIEYNERVEKWLCKRCYVKLLEDTG